MPTTVVHGLVSAPTRMHCPSASLVGHSVLAIASLTTVTSGAFFVSVASMPRPRMIRVPAVRKYSGDAACRRYWPRTVSNPCTNSSSSHIQ